MSTPLALEQAPAVFTPEQEERLYKKVVLRLVPYLFIFYVFDYLDRVNISFAKLEMLGDLKWSDTVYGLGAGMFFIGYFVFEIPGNLILYKFGARRWLAAIMAAWGLISSAMMFVTSPVSFYAMRFLLGLAEAGFFPGVILYLTYWFPQKRRGGVMALFVAAIGFCGIIGGPLSGLILHSFGGVGGLAGWKWLLAIEGVPSVLLDGKDCSFRRILVSFACGETKDTQETKNESKRNRSLLPRRDRSNAFVLADQGYHARDYSWSVAGLLGEGAVSVCGS